ncbi:MAG: NosD domain-containing protein, partial [Phycisphaeraceae bacterium]
MKSHRQSWRRSVTALLLVAMLSLPAVGEMTRVLPGDDLQQAIDTADDGGTLLLAAGVHRGPVTVSKPLTLRGEGDASIVGTGIGSVLTLEADDVRVEHLAIRRSGRDLSKDDAGILITGDRARIIDVTLHNNLHGIYVRGGKDVRLVANTVVGLAATEDTPRVIGGEAANRDDGIHHSPPGVRALMGNGLHLWDANGAVVDNNLVQHVRDGIYVAHTHHAEFRRNRIHHSRYAIHYMYSSDNVVADNELWRNVAGAALMFSQNLDVHGNILRDHSGFRAYGLLLQNVDASRFHDNAIRGNR